MHPDYCRHTHAHTLSLTPTYTEPSVTRASGCCAPALMEGLTSAMLSYFHPPQIFRHPEEKGVEGKWRDRQHEIWLFSLQTSNSLHLASQFTGSRDHLLCNEKVAWRREWSLLRERPSALTTAFRWNCQNVFLSHYHPFPSWGHSLNCYSWSGSYFCSLGKYTQYTHTTKITNIVDIK